MGNPHIVIFVADVDAIDLRTLGPKLEHHSLFPERTNVHWVSVNSRTDIKMRSWERGAGETLACGTGACACVVAASLNGFTERLALVHLPGGDLSIDWTPAGNVMMTGPAKSVFTGEIGI